MKKIFAFATAMIFALSLNATVVTLAPGDFTEVASAAAINQTVKGVTVQISNGLINSSQIRIYKNHTITLSADKEISAVVFTCAASGDAQYGPGCFEAQDGYSFKNTVGTWVGTPATSLAFKASTAQVRALQIEVYFDGETPAEDTWVADTVSVTAARALIDASDKHDHYIVGVVATALTDQYGNGKVSFFMTDETTDTDSLQAYELLNAENKAWASLEEAQAAIHQGDTLLIYAGSLAKYYETYEATACHFVKVLGANPDAPVVTIDTLTATAALEAAKALAVGETKKVAVRCYIASIKTPYDSQFGNVTVWLNDDPTSTYGNIQAYRAKCSAEDGAALAEHDLVLVVGNITHTQNEAGDKDFYEIAQGAQLTILEKAQGIENIVLTEKAQKVVVDGVVYVVRDGKMFNVLGTQVR